MEVRANYLAVGIFTLGLFLAGILFTLWIARQDDIPMDSYDIYMRESVVGLTLNSDVLFNGVRVGSVSQIKISDTDPGAVNIRVFIAADTPVREDSFANLVPRGVTGLSLVSISGGTADSPKKDLAPGEVGVIKTMPSALDSVMQNFPQTLSAANEVLRRFNELLSPGTVQSFSDILSSAATLSSTLAGNAGRLEGILSNFDKTGKLFLGLAGTAERLVSGMEPGLRQFTREGLADVRALVLEARSLIQTLNRIGRQVENNPRRFFFGDSIREYPSP
ncbi:MAG: MlaD family protein [Deltaproteobacteria bacterium]|jgi:phospholipid/cholesterol/gamma-HCH transport system substrate-binding protein|nr:MlaD family protein [Deltaproteobacteria bacterium]